MSTYKSFALIGSGTLGMPILTALASHPSISIVVLTRQDPSAKSLPAGVATAQVDYADTTAVAAVFTAHAVEVVICTIATSAVGTQNVLVDAAKMAGVKLFVPSEFGMVSQGQEGNPKEQVAGECYSASVYRAD
jgi:saccharopine dehydrogenase-like NADP-dependent oxidoreductase